MVQKKEIQCNVCGKTRTMENGILMDDGLIIRKEWGYFSHKDLEVHQFCICEECYDNMVASFKIPVKIIEKELVFQD